MTKMHFPLLLCVGLIPVLIGCGKKDAKTELERATDTIAKADAGQAQPVPATPSPTPSEPAATPAAEPAPSTPPAQQMRDALASYKAGNLEDAVTRLQKLRATPTLSPQQRMAVQDAVAAVMGEVYGMAAKGDARAIQAVKQYEQMQTMPR